MAIPKKVREEKKEIVRATKQAPEVIQSLEKREDLSGLFVKWIREGLEKSRERAWEIDLME